MFDVAIIGAGISGLTCGYYLKRAGLNIAVIEASHAGGAVRSHRVGPYLLEAGPNSLRGNSKELLQLIDDLELAGELIESSPAAKKRYLYRDGALLPTPSSLLDAITSPLIPIREKLKFLREPFIAPTTKPDESIRDFASRRISPWFADNIIDPVITGIYAGDISRLSTRSSFPKMWELEQMHGSLIKGAIAGKRGKKSNASNGKPKGIFSFRDGLHTLTDALRQRLENSMVEGLTVTEIQRTESGYHLVGPNLDAKQVVFAGPAYKTADLMRHLEQTLADDLDRIEHPHVAVVSLAFKKHNVGNPLDGFGFLVPSEQKRDILGCIFTSTLWEGRAPADEALLTIMVGGSKRPEMSGWTDEQIIDAAEREVQETLSVTGAPEFTHVTRWQKAIPQYHLGHHKINESLEAFERANPDLHFCSNYRGGISIGNCVTNATELAQRLVAKHAQ